jgi:hypothetical protein
LGTKYTTDATPTLEKKKEPAAERKYQKGIQNEKGRLWQQTALADPLENLTRPTQRSSYSEAGIQMPIFHAS